MNPDKERDKIEPMNQKGFAPLIIIVIATLVIGAGVGGFLVFREKNIPAPQEVTQNQQQLLEQPVFYSCPDRIEYSRDFQTRVVEKGVTRSVGADEQNWIETNCKFGQDPGKELSVQNTESVKPPAVQTEPKISQQPQDPSLLAALPACPKNISGIFTYPIVDNDAIDHIPPMGHINAKNKHVLPIPHTYIIFKKDGDVTRKTQIFSPADLLVQDISKVDVFDKSGKLVLSDFSIYFSPCKEIRVSFIHVSELSDLMAQMYNAVEAYCYRAGANINICKADINKKITAGDPIGWGGYSLPGLDVPIDDTRVSHPFISKERYNTHSLQGICPLDLYAGDLKISLYEKLTDPDGNKRITEPRCGSVAQDIAGTAQGEWFAPGTHELSADAESNGKVLSIVHYNLEPSPGLAGVIAVSGTIVPYSGMIAFVPRHDGFINREPSEIKDQNIFCFQNEQGSFTKYVVGDGRIFTGRILTQLVDASRLKAEYQEKNCDEAFNFVSPTIYER